MAHAPAPPPPGDPSVHATLAAIESLGNTLAVARALVAAGRRIELDGLEGETARLCAALACLPAGAGEALRLPLRTLAGEVDRLIGALQAA